MFSLPSLASKPVRPPRPRPTAAPKGAGPRRYNIKESFFKDAVDQAIMASLFSPVSLGERHDVKLKPKFETACWAHLPPHRIYIGLDLFEKDMVKLEMSEELQRKYIANHYHHELAHALFTIRDLKVPKKVLSSMKAPFSLWNLFEDAYIEERYRREAEYKFDWRTMEDGDFNARPESLLFALIQREGDQALVEADLKAWTYDASKTGKPDGPVALDATKVRFADSVKEALEVWLPKVVLYYHRAIAAKKSMDLMPVIKAWIDEFGLPPAPPPDGKGQGQPGDKSDLELADELTSDPDALAEFDNDATPVNKPDSNKCSGGKEESGEDKPDRPVSQKGQVLQDHEHSIDMYRVGLLANKFKKFFEEVSRRVSSRTPQRRISARHYAVGRSPYRKEQLQGRGKKNVVVIVDCSGSMSGEHIREGRVLVAVLSELARTGYLEGHVVFSGVNRGPIHETYALPMNVSTIARADGCFGGEGLESAIRANMALCKKADYVFVYTDAQISDQRLNKTELHSQGIFTWGLYAGSNQNYLTNMLAYFDKGILRKNADELIDAMLAQNK